MTKQNLPNSSTTNDNLTSEMNEYNRLFSLKPRSSSGDISFTSISSGITYDTETYASGLYANLSQEGLLLILQDVLKDYLISAEDYNYFVDSVTQVNNSFTEINGTLESNISNVKEQLARNSYDDYLLWLELYYKGYISQVEAENAKAIVFDGFMDEDIETNHYDLSSAVPSETKKLSLYVNTYYVKFTADETLRGVRRLTIPFATLDTTYGHYFRVDIIGEDSITGAPIDSDLLGSFSIKDTSTATGNLATPLEVDFGKIINFELGKKYFFKIYSDGDFADSYWSLYYNDLSLNPAHQLWSNGAQIGNQEIIMSWEKISSSAYIDTTLKQCVNGGRVIEGLPTSVVLWNDTSDSYTQTVFTNNIIDGSEVTKDGIILAANTYKYVGQKFDFGQVKLIDELIIRAGKSGSWMYYTLLKLQSSIDGVIWTDIPFSGGNSTGLSTTIGSVVISFEPVVARYIRESSTFNNSDDGVSATLYVYEYKFRLNKVWDSSLYTEVKTLPFTPSLVDLYFSVKEMSNAIATPFISFDGGETFTAMTYIEERDDSKFEGFKEKLYQLAGTGTEIQFRFDLTTDELGNERALIKRYGLIIS